MGGIAVARVSGPRAIETVDRVWRGKSLAICASHTAHLGEIIDPARDGEPLDQAVATIFRGPKSFTGEDVVELSVHGSRFIQTELIRLLCRNGARLAEPGEFTRRAFAAGKLDLAQAEAVADVIAANSRAALRVAGRQMRGAFSERLASLRQQLLDLAALLELELDFSEEDVEFASRERLRSLAGQILDEIERLRTSFAAGTAIKEGIPVAIAGPTNAGKSSLLNALLNDDRAIVSDIHGTTRDTIEDTLTIGDHLFRIIDTAGLRETPDAIEQAGIRRSMRAIERASVILAVIDASSSESSVPLIAELRTAAPDIPIILLRNKIDLLQTLTDGSDCADRMESVNSVIAISAKNGYGIERLCDTLSRFADDLAGSQSSDVILITNQRHYDALTAAIDPLRRLLTALTPNTQEIPLDLMAQDLREAIFHLSTITGSLTTPDILATIFSRFCIGK